MSQEEDKTEMLKKRVVYRMAGADAVRVRRDVPYAGFAGNGQVMDIYYPPDRIDDRKTPAVLLVSGFAGEIRRIAAFSSWAELLAASGVIGVTCATRDPVADMEAALNHLRDESGSLGIDPDRIGILASSGHVPNALSLLMQPEREYLRCAVLCYGFTLDLGRSNGVADAAARFGFVNPSRGKSVQDLPPRLPLFLVRAGQDEFDGLNDALGDFVQSAVRANLPITFVNHPRAPHAFDVMDDTDATRDIIRRILSFVRFHLSLDA